MLPAPARLRSSTEFAIAFRGRRVQRGHLVAHLGHVDDAHRRVGLSVSKAVGNSVVRHAVSRKLRHVMYARINQLPVGSRLVLRALPHASFASSSELAADVDAALNELIQQ